MIPTTPVRPMPVTSSSTPKLLSFSATESAVLKHIEIELGIAMQIVSPASHFVLHFRDAVDDRHGFHPCWKSRLTARS